MVSGARQRDSAIHTHVSILLQTPVPSRLPHNSEQSSLCYTVGPCWLSIYSIAVCTCPSQVHVHEYPFPSPFPPAAAAKSLQPCPTLCDPVDSSPQAPLSAGFSRQEYWSGLPFPSPPSPVSNHKFILYACESVNIKSFSASVSLFLFCQSVYLYHVFLDSADKGPTL